MHGSPYAGNLRFLMPAFHTTNWALVVVLGEPVRELLEGPLADLGGSLLFGPSAK